MTDLEITRLCAEAMGGKVEHDLPRGHRGVGWIRLDNIIYNPLHDDAQCFALIKRFGLYVIAEGGMGVWHVAWDAEFPGAKNKDLSRAICECVAKMQAAK